MRRVTRVTGGSVRLTKSSASFVIMFLERVQKRPSEERTETEKKTMSKSITACFYAYLDPASGAVGCEK